MKEACGGTSGAGESSSTRSMTLRMLLKEMAKKYDQYDDYMQQDSHELLRHLLDSMEMEEKDVIKRLQPIPPPSMKKRPRSKSQFPISPLQSPLPSPAVSSTSSPGELRALDSTSGSLPVQQSSPSSYSSGGVELGDIPEEEVMVPFVAALFGGSLASVVVCDNCKSVSPSDLLRRRTDGHLQVSHTYEGFLDISLSLKSAPRARKVSQHRRFSTHR